MPREARKRGMARSLIGTRTPRSGNPIRRGPVVTRRGRPKICTATPASNWIRIWGSITSGRGIWIRGRGGSWGWIRLGASLPIRNRCTNMPMLTPVQQLPLIRQDVSHFLKSPWRLPLGQLSALLQPPLLITPLGTPFRGGHWRKALLSVLGLHLRPYGPRLWPLERQHLALLLVPNSLSKSI